MYSMYVFYSQAALMWIAIQSAQSSCLKGWGLESSAYINPYDQVQVGITEWCRRLKFQRQWKLRFKEITSLVPILRPSEKAEGKAVCSSDYIQYYGSIRMNHLFYYKEPLISLMHERIVLLELNRADPFQE